MANINIGGRLHSTATGNTVAGANEILDDTKQKKQSQINQETDNALSDRYTKEETYSKTELDNLITTPNVNYVTVTATDQTTDVTDVLPATGSADTVYRVGSWDGTQYDTTVYSEYAWDGTQYVLLDVKAYGIDDVPTANSNNLVKSGGVYSQLNQLDQDISNLEDTQEQLLIVTHGIEITKSDFSLDGIYSSTSMTISSNANYKSTPIYDVNPGDVFVWNEFPVVSTETYALSMYDEEGVPIVPSGWYNNRVRADQSNLAEGYTIPSGVKKVGFVWNNGEYPLTEQSNITSGEDSIELTQEAKNLLNEELGLNEMNDDIQDAKEESEKAKNEVELIIEQIPETKKIPSDFTTTGLWKTSVAEIDSSYSNYCAVALLDVVEGQVITWHKWQHGGSVMNSVAAIFCYDNDGLPYNGSTARINYDGLTTYNLDTGEFTFKIPSNCSQIGLAYNFTAYSVQEGAEIIISEESVELTDLAKELINNAVEQSDEVGNDTSKYYLKGNSNIVYSPTKKLGIIAAGQSNIDGRNSYSDYPYLSVNPNPKVHFKNSKNGAFASFEITNGGQNNDWSFDAIVYNLLTDSSYGNLSDIYVMKKSMGGTSIDPMGATDYHWTADYEFLTSESASLLRTFEEIVRAGISSDGSSFDIKAMLWHQGEGDMQNEQVANRYYENLKNMLAYVRGIVGNPRLYFFCGNISLNRTSPGYINIINAAYTKIASEDPYFKVVDMSNAQLEDGYHFNYQWSIYFGQKVYDLMIDAGIITGTKINPSEPS